MNAYCTMGIIPARYASQRLPGKPLIMINGKSLIQRVCERVEQAEKLDHFCVATDDILIYNHVKKLGYDVVMTRYDQPSGTFRCAEVLGQFPMVTHVVNIQGDEPLIDPKLIDQMASFIIGKTGMKIATLMHQIEDPKDLVNPNVVKVTVNTKGEAMYFSRQAIPFVRDFPVDTWLEHGEFYKHIGMYAYTASALKEIENFAIHPYESMERLEQLTWLSNGMPIFCMQTDSHSRGIDTEEDLKVVAEIIMRAEKQAQRS